MEKELDLILNEFDEGNMCLNTLKAKLLLLLGVNTRFDSIEICTYSKDNMCQMIEGKYIICNGKWSENSGKCKFYIGLRRRM